DLSLVLLLAALFVIPGRSAQRTFDVDGAAFLEVFARDFGGAAEGNQVVPLGLVLPVAIFVFGALGRCQRKARAGHAALGVFHFGILAQIAEQNDFIDASCHEIAPSTAGDEGTRKNIRWRR